MSHIHFIGGEKGGVGKSLMARVLAQHFLDRGWSFVAFDTDRSHGALLRYHAAQTQPAVPDEQESLDRIVEAAAEEPQQRHVLVDLAAQTQGKVTRWLEDSGVVELMQELRIGLTHWQLLDNGRDSVELLSALLDRFGGRLRIVLVCNELRGEAFDLLAASGQRERALTAGAQLITLPRLPDATMQKIDATAGSLRAAIDQPDPGAPTMGLLERQRAKVWLQRIGEQIDKLGL